MRIRAIFPLMIGLFLIQAAPAEPGIKVGTVEAVGQVIKAADKSSGQLLWQSRTASKMIKNEKGEQYVLIEDNGSGIYGQDKKQKGWKTDAYIKVGPDSVAPYQVKQVIKNEAGKTIVELEKYYDAGAGKVFCKVNGRPREFAFHDDLIDREMFGLVLANYPLDKKEIVLHLLTHEPTLYKITIRYLGNEKVNLAGREIDCYKLEMIPDLGALNLLGAFVPKTYFWYQLAAPHRFVRYEGLESGLGTPYIVMEVAKREKKE